MQDGRSLSVSLSKGSGDLRVYRSARSLWCSQANGGGEVLECAKWLALQTVGLCSDKRKRTESVAACIETQKDRPPVVIQASIVRCDVHGNCHLVNRFIQFALLSESDRFKFCSFRTLQVRWIDTKCCVEIQVSESPISQDMRLAHLQELHDQAGACAVMILGA